MAAGAPLIASDTGPVQEVLSHGSEALLAPFDQPRALASALESCLSDKLEASQRALNAQNRVAHYSASLGLEGWLAILEGVG